MDDLEPPYLLAATTLLMECHETVEALFARFDAAEDFATRRKIVEEALHELKVHATIEELMLEPALEPERERRRHVRRLIEELEPMTGEERRHDAKFALLRENVRRHFRRAEEALFAGAARAAELRPAWPARLFSGLDPLTLLGFEGRLGAEAAENPLAGSYAIDT